MSNKDNIEIYIYIYIDIDIIKTHQHKLLFIHRALFFLSTNVQQMTQRTVVVPLLQSMPIHFLFGRRVLVS